MASSRVLDFYFDFISPYPVLAWAPLQALVDARPGVEVRLRPILFAGLLDRWGQLGPAEIAPKREWTFRDVLRQAALRGTPWRGVKAHPFNPLTALRVSLPEVCGDDQRRVVEALWRAGWIDGGDLGDPRDIRRALDGAGLDGQALLERASSPPVKAALRAATDQALERGVFGVPTILVEGELVWGADRLRTVELILDGEDPLDREHLAEVLARPRGADRAR
ncbi:MAG: 2-hydroxychromene-2-carboxylate isomerase [Sandaracinaceae bacterium]